MIPREKIEAIVAKHDNIEKELSSGSVDPKTYASKSKEYSELGSIVGLAKDYLKIDTEKKDLEQMLEGGDKEITNLAEKELEALKTKKVDYEHKLKIFLLPKDKDDNKKN